jgi:hypothetical protein
MDDPISIPYQPTLPRYWDRIDEEDQKQYILLRSELSSPAFSNQRGRSNSQFGAILNLIKAFVVRGTQTDLNRALVCGILWLPRNLAVNIHQLQILTSKCKSSLNGSLHNMGYGTIPTGLNSAGELIATYPWMKDNYAELRRWTVRQLLQKPAQDRGDGVAIRGLLPPPAAVDGPFRHE